MIERHYITPLLCIAALLMSGSALNACKGAEPAKEQQQSPTKTPKKVVKVAKKAPQLPIAQGLPSFAPLVERARPAVINIYTKTRLNRPARNSPFTPFVPKARVAESLGSGFIISNTGLALTNHHVIQNATDIEVRLLDNRRFKAKIIGQDPKTDVALLQIQGAKTLPFLAMANSEQLKVGEWLVAIGNPLGLTSTVTAGIASAVGRRNVPLSGEMMYQDFIQTDASINPGNSGGPLLNTRGEVVGINTAVSAEGQGIGFAIPSNMVMQILPQLKTHGKVQRSWLGIYVSEVPTALKKQLGIKGGGALIKNVVRGGPAQLAKLKPGDVIVKFDNKPVSDSSRLSWMASMKGVGKKVPVEFYRGTQRMGTHLKLGALPN